MRLAHILTQVQNDNYLVDYDRSSFGSGYAYVCSMHKGLIIKMDIGKRQTDKISWMAEIKGVTVGSGIIKDSISIGEVLKIISNLVDNSTGQLELKLVSQF